MEGDGFWESKALTVLGELAREEGETWSLSTLSQEEKKDLTPFACPQ